MIGGSGVEDGEVYSIIDPTVAFEEPEEEYAEGELTESLPSELEPELESESKTVVIASGNCRRSRVSSDEVRTTSLKLCGGSTAFSPRSNRGDWSAGDESFRWEDFWEAGWTGRRRQ